MTAAYLDILYFAWVREAAGMDDERIEHPGAQATVGDVTAMLAGRSERHRAALGDPARLRAALDQRFVGMDAPIGDARELALFPPVTGG